MTVFAAEMNPLPCRSGHDGDDLGNGNGFFGAAVPGATLTVRNTGSDISQTTKLLF